MVKISQYTVQRTRLMLNGYYKRNFIGIGTVLRLIGNDDKTRGIIAVIVNIGSQNLQAVQLGSLFACNGCFMKLPLSLTASALLDVL